MAGIIYFAILLCSIAFAIVAVYICVLLRRISKSMKAAGRTLEQVEQQLQQVSPQLSESLRETSTLVDDVNEKVKATDSLFDTVGNLGMSVNTVNEVYKEKRKQTSDEEIFEKAKPFIEGIKWSEALMQIYYKWRRDKPSTETQLVVQDEETSIIPLNQTGKEG